MIATVLHPFLLSVLQATSYESHNLATGQTLKAGAPGVLEPKRGGRGPGGESAERGEGETENGDFFLHQFLAHFSLQIKTRSKRGAATVKGKQGVMYINLDGGGGEERVETFEASGLLALLPSGGEQCPSTADSSAVSLSQMAFLSMAVSIFRSPIK